MMRGWSFEEEIDSRAAQLEKKSGNRFLKKDFLRWMLSDGAGASGGDDVA